MLSAVRTREPELRQRWPASRLLAALQSEIPRTGIEAVIAQTKPEEVELKPTAIQYMGARRLKTAPEILELIPDLAIEPLTSAGNARCAAVTGSPELA
jgi:hypothetical protein